MAQDEQEWRRYERHIFEQLTAWAGGEAKVEFDQRLPGTISKVERQIDCLITGRFAGETAKDIRAVVDCKHYTRELNVTHDSTSRTSRLSWDWSRTCRRTSGC